jgi:hypothetical protein
VLLGDLYTLLSCHRTQPVHQRKIMHNIMRSSLLSFTNPSNLANPPGISLASSGICRPEGFRPVVLNSACSGPPHGRQDLPFAFGRPLSYGPALCLCIPVSMCQAFDLFKYGHMGAHGDCDWRGVIVALLHVPDYKNLGITSRSFVMSLLLTSCLKFKALNRPVDGLCYRLS